jgi:lipopolysaccharide export system protein LptA
MRILLLIISCSVLVGSSAQTGKRIEILHANSLEFDEKLAPGAQRLIGAVRLKHQNTIMSCDSAWLYEDQSMKAFSRVHLQQGDTLDIRGKRLEYSGVSRSATMIGDVRLNDPQVELMTDRLTYELNSSTAYYTTGGKIVSKRERNTLTSRKGQYQTGFKEFIFSDSVVLVHPDRRIESDTLKYRTNTGMAVFGGPTTIDQGRTRIFCTSGWYDTRTDHSELDNGARIWYDEQELLGDTVTYDRESGLGEAWGNVLMRDTVNNITVTGDFGRYNELTDKSLVTGHAELIMLVGEDSLFMHSDTLVAVNDSTGERVLHAFHGVRFYKEDMQGVCDSLVYALADSTINFWTDPYLWTEDEQLSGDTIALLLRNGKAHRLFINGHAFMMSLVDSMNYDQISGTDMIGYFVDSDLDRIYAEGNCRTVYHAREDLEDGTQKPIGINRADCSKIIVRVQSRSVDRITFITHPKATMYPPGKAPIGELVLEGAIWNGDARPRDRNDIFR